MAPSALKRIRTSVLEVAYAEHGPPDGVPVLLMHGWPYDPRTYDEVAPRLAAAGCRAIVPYLRGFGPTRFLSDVTPRSGQQAALGNDLREFMDALGLKSAALVGYDWGGRAACIVAALWPERLRCLVTGNGYNIQDIAKADVPAPAEQEHRFWYQILFPDRARPRRTAKEPARHHQAAVAFVVAELAIRRCCLRPFGRVLGQCLILSMSPSSRTVIVTATRPAILRWKASSASSRPSRRSRCQPSFCTAKPMAS